MRVLLFLAALFVVGSSACTKPSPGPSVMTMTCFGYAFVFEREGDGRSGFEGKRNVDQAADGKEVIDKDLLITCGHQTARIINGKVTVGGKDRGVVKLGDSFAITSSGKLSVNGEERKCRTKHCSGPAQSAGPLS